MSPLLQAQLRSRVGFAWPCFAYVLLRKVQSMTRTLERLRTAVLAAPEREPAVLLCGEASANGWFLGPYPYNSGTVHPSQIRFSDAAKILCYFRVSIGFSTDKRSKTIGFSCGPRAPWNARNRNSNVPIFFILFFTAQMLAPHRLTTPVYKDEFKSRSFSDRHDIMTGRPFCSSISQSTSMSCLYICAGACGRQRRGGPLRRPKMDRCLCSAFYTSQLRHSIGTCLVFQAAMHFNPSPGVLVRSSDSGCGFVEVPQEGQQHCPRPVTMSQGMASSLRSDRDDMAPSQPWSAFVGRRLLIHANLSNDKTNLRYRRLRICRNEVGLLGSPPDLPGLSPQNGAAR